METHHDTASLHETWTRVFDRVRQEVDVPTVWLALEAVRPMAIDGSYFVTAMPPDSKYLTVNLQSAEVSAAIEDALQQVTGRVLAFRLIEGQTWDDWQREKPRDETASPAPPANAAPAPVAQAASVSRTDREVYPTWEKLSDRLVHGYKTAPLMKFPQGQARYILESVQAISDTMDLLMPGPGHPHGEAQERTLAKMLERLGSVVNLDPLFLALELMRLRERDGKAWGD